VENILQFSRSERETTRLVPGPVELAPLVHAVTESFQPILRAKHVAIVSHVEPGMAVLADAEALRQVLLNLLDNAVKYGPPGQELRVGAERAGGALRLFVEDQGPGVPERDRERVWTSWQRLRRDERRAISGSGIGLTVVRDLVALHGGRAWVESAAGGGARFVVELPIAPVTAAPRPVVAESPVGPP
jgi:signal transduction histidine kinase